MSVFGLNDYVRIVNPYSGRYHQVGKVIKVLPAVNDKIEETYIVHFKDGTKLGFGINELQKIKKDR